MRFENLSEDQRYRFLQRLHKKLNKEVFNGDLEEIIVDVRDITKNRDIKLFACYSRDPQQYYQRYGIFFSFEFVDRIKLLKTQKEQALYIVQTLLHEMIHQYCHENGIDDTDHSDEWQRVAAEHQLHSIYHNGEMVEEWLDGLSIPGIIISNLKIQ